jgi:hypothetical protein
LLYFEHAVAAHSIKNGSHRGEGIFIFKGENNTGGKSARILENPDRLPKLYNP